MNRDRHPSLTARLASSCEVCGAKVGELRRGRCWGCYSRWADSRPVGIGAACVLCSDRRHENLKSIELLGAWLPTCHNCAAKAAALDPMPRTIAAIRAILGRERRKSERRIGKDDPRVFQYDRRTGDRRAEVVAIERVVSRCQPVAEVLLDVDDEMILEITELAEELSTLEDDSGEMTRIIDVVRSIGTS